MAFLELDSKAFENFAQRVNDKVNARTVFKSVGKEMQNLSDAEFKEVTTRTPTDTGALKNAWKKSGLMYSDGKFSFKLYNNTSYASFVENGHRTRGKDGSVGKGWVKGQFFLKGMVINYQNNLHAYWEPKFHEAVKDVMQ
ncbi:HK97 gp10 family phage protein (plasmid) [Apilactobacillus apisilvae]|uniref:HK97 gp10 family phage protein n=1 Tax=Apilactobacillus apisilvae TaxID=2923364 RepID=A0ABY4PKR1_9LACO|nr:HK97 gp10 family phage protein [Apilactobacillus apisilvae]UQS85861.1 HK97 gp10 family phage protein [Apilactobacillus apisilvae]